MSRLARSIARRVLFPVLVLCAALPRAVAAQAGDRAIEFEDFGFDRPLPASARASALSAYVASARDASALVSNPACLARIKRKSGIASLSYADATFDYSYAGDTHSNQRDELALQFLGGAYPIPVLRGSLVPALGVQRLFTSSLDLSYQGFNRVDQRDDRFDLQQSGATYAYHFGVGAEIAGALSMGVGLLLFDGDVDRVRQYDVRGRVVDPDVHTFVYQHMAADLGGYGARFGILFNVTEHMHLGATVTTPLVLKLHADTVTEETRLVDNNVGSFTRDTFSETTTYQTPYRVDGGLAFPASRSLLFTVQFAYSDWSQATIDGDRLVMADLSSVLRSVNDVSAGVEWTLARWPVRARAGFARTESPSGFLEADRVDNDRLETITHESATVRLSLGVAYLWRGSIAIDAAVAHARGERASATIEDSRRFTSASIGCGYWF